MIDQIKQLLIPYQTDNLQRYGDEYDGGYIFKKNLLDTELRLESFKLIMFLSIANSMLLPVMSLKLLELSLLKLTLKHFVSMTCLFRH